MGTLASRYFFASVMILFACFSQTAAAEVEVRGTYGGVKKFWDTGARLDEYGVNAIFVGSYGIDRELVARAHAEGARVFSEFATLNGGGYVEKHPEAWPIDEKGERSPKADWFMGVCPTEPNFRAFRMKTLRELLQKYQVDGIWMDYVHWHAQFETPEPILPETCFCDNCLEAFKASTGVAVPDKGSTAEKASWILTNRETIWRDWRCSVVVDWARDMKEIIRQERPGALLGIFHCPWDDEDFGGARRKILGLDFERLAQVADVFSPMVYHGRMERNPEWVRSYLEWFCRSLNIRADSYPKVWPIVQASDEPVTVSAQEFEKVLRWGVGSQATGVMMFTIHSVAANPAKMETMKRVYRQWRDR